LFWSAGQFAFFIVTPALRFIPMKYRGYRSDQGYKPAPMARKINIVAKNYLN